MTLADDNLAVVNAYLAARRDGDGEAAFDFLAEDISQTLMFEMPGAASPGEHRRDAALRKHVRRMVPIRSESRRRRSTPPTTPSSSRRRITAGRTRASRMTTATATSMSRGREDPRDPGVLRLLLRPARSSSRHRRPDAAVRARESRMNEEPMPQNSPQRHHEASPRVPELVRGDLESLSADEFKAAFRGHPGGVAVITADAGDGPVALTATSVSSVSAEPPLLIFSASAISSSTPAFLKAQSVVVHLLDADDLQIAKLGATSGIDRFSDTSLWHRLPTGEPVFNGVRAWIRGAIVNRMEAGGSTVIAVHALQAHVERDLEPGDRRRGAGVSQPDLAPARRAFADQAVTRRGAFIRMEITARERLSLAGHPVSGTGSPRSSCRPAHGSSSSTSTRRLRPRRPIVSRVRPAFRRSSRPRMSRTRCRWRPSAHSSASGSAGSTSSATTPAWSITRSRSGRRRRRWWTGASE